MTAPATTNGTRGPLMRDRVAIGQCWRRRRDELEVRIRQIHRADRTVEVELVSVKLSSALRWMVGERVRWQVPFAELGEKWTEA